MKSSVILFLAIFSVLFNNAMACDTTQYNEACKDEYEKISNLLIELGKKDQNVRATLEDNAEIRAIDNRNTAELKSILNAIGWPTPRKVGEEAANAAWYIAQHTRDDGFRETTLNMVARNVAHGEIEPALYAYMIDRFLIRRGKPQIYGTQAKPFDQWNGIEPVFDPIANPEYIDYLRAGVGLPSFEEYRKKLREVGIALRSGDPEKIKALEKE